jgi:hypothetical protein
VKDNGERVRVKLGDGRQKPNLVDLLDTALDAGAERIMLTQPPAVTPGTRHWMLVQTPGWQALNLRISGGPVSGRYRHTMVGRKVELRTSAEWFGPGLTPDEARLAWIALHDLLKHKLTPKYFFERGEYTHAFMSPARTGIGLWARYMPAGLDPEPVIPEIAALIHPWAGQHHIEHFVGGPSACKCGACLPLIKPPAIADTFADIDGRFMYAATCRELGVGPGRILTAGEATDFLLSKEGAYARARYHVRATVPDTWNHVGILGAKHASVRQGWHYPNRPGAAFTTWADSAEVTLAVKHGWGIEPVGDGGAAAIVFTKSKVLDSWAEHIVNARTAVALRPDLDPVIRDALAVALRAILIQGIGLLKSRGRKETHVTTDHNQVPAEYRKAMDVHGDLFTWDTPATMDPATMSYYRPELAAQVWGRSRARVLEAPAVNVKGSDGKVLRDSDGRALQRPGGGALTMDPATLVGMHGDAIYTTTVPTWSLPWKHQGSDDGAAGRLRLQGVLYGRIKVPVTVDERLALTKRAVKAGPRAAWETPQ